MATLPITAVASEVIKQLEAFGHTVIVFSEYHIRVDSEFDFWPTPRRRNWKWWDRFTGDRGEKLGEQMAFFIHNRIENQEKEMRPCRGK